MIEIRLPIDAAAVAPLEDYFCEQVRCPWGVFRKDAASPASLFGYFEKEGEAAAAWAALRAAFPDFPEKPPRLTLADRDWKEAYKAFLKPWSARGLHWVPVWMRDTYQAPAHEVVFWFDAGLAFGTGDHPTTRLCALRMLDLRDKAGDAFQKLSIVDAGCGSGILAISAALLGCRNVVGFDRDPEAVRVSRANALANGLPESGASFSENGIEAGLENRKADLLLCNIQADVLCLYADTLLAAVRPGGVLVLSGILARENDKVRGVFEPTAKSRFPDARFDARTMGEWSDLAIFTQGAR